MSPFHFAELIEVFVDVELDFLVGDGGSGSAFAASPSAFLLISTMATAEKPAREARRIWTAMKAPCATQLRKSQTPMAHTLQLSVHARRLVTDGRAARFGDGSPGGASNQSLLSRAYVSSALMDIRCRVKPPGRRAKTARAIDSRFTPLYGLEVKRAHVVRFARLASLWCRTATGFGIFSVKVGDRSVMQNPGSSGKGTTGN